MPKQELQNMEQVHPEKHLGVDPIPEESQGPDSQKFHQSDTDAMETMFEYPSPT